jgi:hypothetical protein
MLGTGYVIKGFNMLQNMEHDSFVVFFRQMYFGITECDTFLCSSICGHDILHNPLTAFFYGNVYLKKCKTEYQRLFYYLWWYDAFSPVKSGEP